MDLLDQHIDESYHFYIEAIRIRDEERGYALWLQIYTSPYTKDVPTYEELMSGKTKRKKSELGLKI